MKEWSVHNFRTFTVNILHVPESRCYLILFSKKKTRRKEKLNKQQNKQTKTLVFVCHLVVPYKIQIFVMNSSSHRMYEKIFIPPTYNSMWGYIVFAFPFVRSFVHTFVCSSFCHRVKIFALKFIRRHILKTLWWISFIFGMMVDIGLKFLSAPSQPLGWPWEFHLYLTCW